MTSIARIALIPIAALVLGVPGTGAQTTSDDVLLRRAITREVVDGDRAAAIALYRRLVASGDTVVAAEARSRLTALESGRQSAQLQIRRLFARSAGRPSRDGRLMPVLDGGIQIFDVSTGTFRRTVEPLTGRSESIGNANLSPDGRQVVYVHGD
jgi:hypothetical protein